MKKEEKDHKKIHLLKKQVALMHGEHQEFDKEGFKNNSFSDKISRYIQQQQFHDLGRDLDLGSLISCIVIHDRSL